MKTQKTILNALALAVMVSVVSPACAGWTDSIKGWFANLPSRAVAQETVINLLKDNKILVGVGVAAATAAGLGYLAYKKLVNNAKRAEVTTNLQAQIRHNNEQGVAAAATKVQVQAQELLNNEHVAFTSMVSAVTGLQAQGRTANAQAQKPVKIYPILPAAPREEVVVIPVVNPVVNKIVQAPVAPAVKPAVVPSPAVKTVGANAVAQPVQKLTAEEQKRFDFFLSLSGKRQLTYAEGQECAALIKKQM